MPLPIVPQPLRLLTANAVTTAIRILLIRYFPLGQIRFKLRHPTILGICSVTSAGKTQFASRVSVPTRPTRINHPAQARKAHLDIKITKPACPRVYGHRGQRCRHLSDGCIRSTPPSLSDPPANPVLVNGNRLCGEGDVTYVALALGNNDDSLFMKIFEGHDVPKEPVADPNPQEGTCAIYSFSR